MKIGLLADIHEHVEHLEAALRVLERQAVDRVVVLGDIVETGKRIEATTRLLSQAGASGVF